MKENNDQSLEEMIAKAIEERYGGDDNSQRSSGTSGGADASADRSVYHISDEVIYTQSQADIAYRDAARRSEGVGGGRVSQVRSDDGREARPATQTVRNVHDVHENKNKGKEVPKERKDQKKKKAAQMQSKTEPKKKTGKVKSKKKNNRERTKVRTKGTAGMDDYEEYGQPEEVGEEKPVKKRHPIRTLIRTVFILLLVVVAVYSAVVLHYINMVDIVPEGDRRDAGVSLMESKSVRNILLIGTDTRSVSENGRADTVILVSINFKTRKITLTSFMRDSYVEIPDHGWSKLNASYSWGGPELLMDTLERNFHVAIDDYVFVNFESFAEIVDAVGGVEITVTQAEAEGMQAPMAEVNDINGVPSNTDFLYSGGTYLMNGNQALAYSRLRYVGNADFQRTERQREVIQKILAKAKKLGISGLNEFAATCAGSVTTNMTKGEMYLLSLELLYFISFDVEELRVPMDGAYTGSMIGGQSVLEIDFAKNIAEIEDTIYN